MGTTVFRLQEQLLTICVGRHCHGPKHSKKKTDQGADFHFVGHCPTSISWAIALLCSHLFRGPLPYYHTFRGPLPYFRCYRGPLPYYYSLVFVCCKTRLATFVLRGCDSIRIVPVRI